MPILTCCVVAELRRKGDVIHSYVAATRTVECYLIHHLDSHIEHKMLFTKLKQNPAPITGLESFGINNQNIRI